MKLSKLCNLRCTYCYEYEELSNKERMPLDGLEYFFKGLSQYIVNRKDCIPISLILHGGEALLLPDNYLRAFCALQKKYLDSNGIVYKTLVQSNLFKVSDKTLDLIKELNISLGISLDVFGEQRVDIAGRESQEKVLDNLQRLLDRNVPFGGISVLHALNVDKAVKIYQFYNELGISYRILPIFSYQDSPERLKHLVISYEETVAAMQSVAKAQFSTSSRIQVLPLEDYFKAAVRYLTGCEIRLYNPFVHEWALIVNTNGDVYSHGDAYSSVGLMGNIFEQPIGEILTSEAHINVTKVRMKRAETCRRCEFDRKCDQLPIAEALPSERFYDEAGLMQCLIAKPMIQFMVNEIKQSVEARALLELYKHEDNLLPQIVTA